MVQYNRPLDSHLPAERPILVWIVAAENTD